MRSNCIGDIVTINCGDERLRARDRWPAATTFAADSGSLLLKDQLLLLHRAAAQTGRDARNARGVLRQIELAKDAEQDGLATIVIVLY
jgi:hypothetical protein